MGSGNVRWLMIVILILAICALFLYAAILDGAIAFAMNDCEFCKFMEEHDFEEDAHRFPMNIQAHPMFKLEYQFGLIVRATHGAKGKEQHSFATVKYNIPMNYCPECGRKIE